MTYLLVRGPQIVLPRFILSYKAWIKKKIHFEHLVFAISQLNMHPIFKICVSTPHNYGVIMGGRHKNFEDRMNIEL